MRATVTGALLRVIGTALALWIPLTPLFFIMRRALNGKTNSRCSLVSQHPDELPWSCAVTPVTIAHPRRVQSTAVCGIDPLTPAGDCAVSLSRLGRPVHTVVSETDLNGQACLKLQSKEKRQQACGARNHICRRCWRRECEGGAPRGGRTPYLIHFSVGLPHGGA